MDHGEFWDASVGRAHTRETLDPLDASKTSVTLIPRGVEIHGEGGSLLSARDRD